MIRENAGHGRTNGYSGSGRSTNSESGSKGSSRTFTSTEESCLCSDCLNKPLIDDEMQKIHAAHEVSQPKPKLTQADRDNIVFCSAEFRRYFEQQDKGVVDYAQWLSNAAITWKTQARDHVQEINDLRLKLSKAESVSDVLERELKELRAYVQQMQKEAMSTVDRFQPTTDGEVADRVKLLAAKVQKAVNHIVKSHCRLSDEQWQSAAEDLIYPGTITGDCQPAEVDVRTLKKLSLRNIIWHFLTVKIFDKPFGGFEGDEADSVDDMYRVLFPKQGKSCKQVLIERVYPYLDRSLHGERKRLLDLDPS